MTHEQKLEMRLELELQQHVEQAILQELQGKWVYFESDKSHIGKLESVGETFLKFADVLTCKTNSYGLDKWEEIHYDLQACRQECQDINDRLKEEGREELTAQERFRYSSNLRTIQSDKDEKKYLPSMLKNKKDIETIISLPYEPDLSNYKK